MADTLDQNEHTLEPPPCRRRGINIVRLSDQWQARRGHVRGNIPAAGTHTHGQSRGAGNTPLGVANAQKQDESGRNHDTSKPILKRPLLERADLEPLEKPLDCCTWRDVKAVPVTAKKHVNRREGRPLVAI